MAGPAQPYAAFLSYAPRDGAKAGEIRTLLEERGLRCAVAARGLRAGRGIGRDVHQEMDEARAFVLVVSRATEGSRPTREEILAAHRRGMPIFGIFIERTEPSDELDFFIPAKQRIDASSGRTVDHVAELARQLQGAGPKPITPLGGPTLSPWARRIMGMPGIIVVLALSALLLWAFTRFVGSGGFR